MLSNTSKSILSLAKLNSDTHEDPLQVFFGGIKSVETKNAYRKTFREFLDSVEDFQGTFEGKTKQFTKFARKEPEKLKQLLKNYAIHLKQRSEKPITSSEYLSPSTIPNKFKGIKKFLKMNEIPIEWTNIVAIFPEITNLHPTRGYTTEEVKQILDYSTDLSSDFIILAESSSGMRIGGWENQTWGNINPIYEITTGQYTHDSSKSPNGRIVCASMIVYNETSSKYLGLISIEAWDKLQAVKKQWIERTGVEPKPNDFIILTRFRDSRHFSKNGIKNKMYHIIKRSNIQKSLKKDHRSYEVPATHGMRKRWNKIMSEQKINQDSYANLIRKERLFGHKTGVTRSDNSYFFSEIEESVPQYLLAMPDLMISDEYRAKRELGLVQDENKKLQQTLQEKNQALEMVQELKAKFERFEKYEKKN